MAYKRISPQPVIEGGTGSTTLTNHGVLLGHTTSPITATAAPTNGQVIIGSTGADPAFASLTSTGSSLTYTAGANSLNIDINPPVTVANGGTNATSMANFNGTVYFNGTSLVTAATGNSGDVYKSNGPFSAPSFIPNTLFFTEVVVIPFTSSGVYTPDPGIVLVVIEVLGGGGGGGGCAAGTLSTHMAAAGGGGAGAYSLGVFDPSSFGATETVTIGSGGSGGAAGNNPGTNGGDSSVGSLITAHGALGGSGSPVTNSTGVINGGGAGGASSSGDFVDAQGIPGTPGLGFFNSSANRWAQGGGGGSSRWGGGAQATIVGITSAATAGLAAGPLGSGGSGACLTGVQSAQAGGNGSSGFVIITEYIAANS